MYFRLITSLCISLMMMSTFVEGTEIPRPDNLERVPTLNGYGYIFYKKSPLLEQFIENEALPGRLLIEIGTGFGNAPIDSLKRGVLEYTANDLCSEHLEILKLRFQIEMDNVELEDSRLVLIPGRAPEALPWKKDYYDAILFDKVMHYMTPDDILSCLEWAQKALKMGGKIYILTASPYIAGFKEKGLSIYLDRKCKGIPFPGFVQNVRELVDVQNTIPLLNIAEVPNVMTFFDIEDLSALFENLDIEVIEQFSLCQPTPFHPYWQSVPLDQSSNVAIIGKVKK